MKWEKTAEPTLMSHLGNVLVGLAWKGAIAGILLWAGAGCFFSVKRDMSDAVRMPPASISGYTVSREVLEPVSGQWQYLLVFNNRNGYTEVKVEEGGNGLAALLNNTVLNDNNNNGRIDGKGDYVVKAVGRQIYWYRGNGKVTEPRKDKAITEGSVAGLSREILAQANEIMRALK